MSKRMEEPTDESLKSLEAHLAGTLQPVSLSKDFARRLRSRVRFPEREELISRLRNWKRLFLVFGSVMSGMMLLITVARALYYMFGRRNMA